MIDYKETGTFSLPDHRILQHLSTDILNCVRFGINAPGKIQTIYINPLEVKFIVANPSRYKASRMSGRILDGIWDTPPGSLVAENTARKFIRKRIRCNLTWAETGAYERMMTKIARFGTIDGCSSLNDVIMRYDDIDRFIAHLQAGGSFLSRRELDPGNLREMGGVVIHIGRNGELLGSEKGNHRLAIAQELALRWIPAQVACSSRNRCQKRYFP